MKHFIIMLILLYGSMIAAQTTTVIESGTLDTILITNSTIVVPTTTVIRKPYKPPTIPPVATNKFYISAIGNDANNGTSPLTAWRTISKINSRTFLPGDSILFRRGDMWREQITIPSSGVDGKLITFGAYGTGAKPIINGADIITTGWSLATTNVWTVINPNATPARAMIIIDDTIYSEVPNLVSVNSPRKYFINSGRIYVYSLTSPATRKTEISKRDYCIVTASGIASKKFIEIADIEVRYAGRAGIYFEGQMNSPINGSSVVRRSLAYGNRLFGMAHYDHYDNVTFEDCEANYNGNGLYSWVADEGTFRRCSTANQIHYDNTSGFTDGGAIQGYQSDNWLVENCYSINDYDAIHIDAGGLPTNAIIRYNKVFNSRFGSPNTPTMGVGSVAAGGVVQFYYNLIVNGASNAFECYTKILGRVDFFNNTIYLKPGTGTDGTIYLAYGDNFVFKNNLITREGSARTLLTTFNPNVSTYDYNHYFNFPPVFPYMFYYRAYYQNLTNWRSGTGQDINSQSGDPLFVNRLSDWSLQNNSPCINKGVNVGLTKDINGNSIIGLPDIGCFENQNP